MPYKYNPFTNRLDFYESSGGGGGITSLTGDIGTAATGSNIDVITGVSTINSGSSVEFTSGGSTLTLNVTDSSSNTIIGNGSGNSTLLFSGNTALGSGVLSSLTFGGDNCVIGLDSAPVATSASSNCIFGNQCASTLINGNGNTFVGSQVCSTLISGSNNVCISAFAGNNYTGSESNNILISNVGIAGEFNTIRIGTQGTDSNQQNQLITVSPVLVSDVAVGSIAYGFIDNPTTGIGNNNNPVLYLYTNGSAGITLAEDNLYTPPRYNSFSNGMTYQINNQSVSYAMLDTDYFVGFNTSGGPITVTLPVDTADGEVYIIKDTSGNALTNNITISGNGNAIEGSGTLVLNTPYASATLLFNGTTWSVI